MASYGINPEEIAELSPAILATIPAASPPPGIQPNFLHPQSRVPVILGVGTTFFVIASICFFIRLYTKIFLVKKLQWDDLTCFLGFAFSVVYFSAVILGGAGRHIWDLHLNQILGPASLYQDYVTTAIITPGLGFIKSTLFIQYYRYFKPLRWMRICVWVGVTISTLFYLPVSIVGFILNSPWPGESLLDDILSTHYLEFAKFSIPTGVVGMLVDWYLLILPIPAVLSLHMSLTKRLGLLLVFMTGTAAAAASTACLYYRVQLQKTLNSDVNWQVGYVLLLAQIEMFAGIAVSSSPSVNKFFAGKESPLSMWSLSLKSSVRYLRDSIARRRGSRGSSDSASDIKHEWENGKQAVMRTRELS